MGLFEDIKTRTLGMQTPGKGMIGIVLGVLNLFIFGLGTIIGGLIEGNTADIVIGLIQFLFWFIGWIWSIVWGVLMIVRNI